MAGCGDYAVPLSWRDPDGYVVKVGGRILRAVVPQKAAQTRELLTSPWLVRLIDQGLVPRTTEAPSPSPSLESSEQMLWLEHELLDFPCYPHEITALQLHDSADLTLRITIEAAEHGWILKDASAWNVLHSNGRPVFVDLLSFDKLAPRATWIAYGQFVRHFVLPLMLYRKIGMSPQEIFLIHRDGVSPEHAYQLLRGLNLLSAAGLEFVLLPRLLSPGGTQLIAAQQPPNTSSFGGDMALPLLLRTLRRLQRILKRLRPNPSGSTSLWNRYEETRAHYSGADLTAKTAFVRENLADSRRVLDIGCNAGEFSLLAAEAGRTVVAADSDEPALSRLYARVRGKNLPVTPVLLNIARPTPAIGWENSEVDSFLMRSVGHFDCILALGVIHHLLISERTTVPLLVGLLDRLGPERVILEWVEPKDQKFQQLAGVNYHLYKDLNSDRIEACMAQNYTMRERLPLPGGTRVMYLWCKTQNCSSWQSAGIGDSETE